MKTLKRIGQGVVEGLIAFAAIALLTGFIALMRSMSWIVDWFVQEWQHGLPWCFLTMILMTIARCVIEPILEWRRRKSNQRQDAMLDDGTGYQQAVGKREAH